MKMVSLEQSHEVMAKLATNVAWSEVSSDAAQRIINDPVGSGLEFVRFLMNGGRVISADSNVLPIPRATPFNPAQFIGEGWSIWKGPADGDGLSGAEDQDERSLALTQLDISQVQLVTCLQEGETSTTGEERIKRLKANNLIRLDVGIFQALWESKRLIPKSWKKKTNGNITYVFFDGTPLRSPLGFRFVLYLYWRGGGWRWGCYWLGRVRGVNVPSAVLAS